MTKSMDTDSFILALHHFIARHGNFRSILCDNESNFIEAEKELEIYMNEMDNQDWRFTKEKSWSDCVKEKPTYGKPYGGSMGKTD